MNSKRPFVVQEVSAGGFVLAADGSNRVALIGRRSRSGRLDWCLPKGHPENQETLEEAAIREIFEETGLVAEIIEPLGDISYEFSAGRKVIQKTVHHFLMRQIGGVLTVDNDPHHEAEQVDWVDLDALHKKLAHENERKLVHGVFAWLERNT